MTCPVVPEAEAISRHCTLTGETRGHRDPCDRFIIAAALARDLPVATADPVFARYGLRVMA